MSPDFYMSVEQAFASERLGAYSGDQAASNIVLGRYLLNMALCESLYSPLQMCEIALRNSIHSHLSNLFGRADWYDDQGFALTRWAEDEIEKAKSKLIKSAKPLTPGRVVAELQFGFWTSLFEAHYERQTRFLPSAIKAVFPHLPKSLHHRKHRKSDLENIRQLRNRVFHHERILHWADLDAKHALVLEVIKWINPKVHQLALDVDRFTQIRQAGLQPWLQKLTGY